ASALAPAAVSPRPHVPQESRPFRSNPLCVKTRIDADCPQIQWICPLACSNPLQGLAFRKNRASRSAVLCLESKVVFSDVATSFISNSILLVLNGRPIIIS
ncbi:hypothetical protein, partial [Peribacillus sp. SI8-4]|uniref:hypothetical protein n=1 Tax=Peribacillus sp. SI8-4 TaxID=3048009 RepID=UPI002554B4BC